jgi:paraquat-inducible protein B
MSTEKNLTESLQLELAELNELGQTLQAEIPAPGQLAQMLLRLRRVHARVQELHNRALGSAAPRFGEATGYFQTRPHAVS